MATMQCHVFDRASTEPRHRGRGSGGRLVARQAHHRASTEPRHRGRGSPLGRLVVRDGEAASTEPRHRGRGSFVQALAERLIRALQRSPGIAAGDRTCSATSPAWRPRFNGAPASRPGIGLARLLRRELVSALQRSPGIAAGDRGEGLHRRRSFARLQRSPGIAAGDRRRTTWARRTRSRFNGAPASRPGIGRAEDARGVRREASTEPRHRGRGSQVFPSCSCTSCRLQRSPGIAAGDRVAESATKLLVRMLQRSPGIAAGDRPG